jgi:hypothetical protein
MLRNYPDVLIGAMAQRWKPESNRMPLWIDTTREFGNIDKLLSDRMTYKVTKSGLL